MSSSDSAPIPDAPERLRRHQIRQAEGLFPDDVQPAAPVHTAAPRISDNSIREIMEANSGEPSRVYLEFTVELPVLDIKYKAIALHQTDEVMIVVQDNQVPEFAPKVDSHFLIRPKNSSTAREVTSIAPPIRFTVMGLPCQMVLLLFRQRHDNAEDRKTGSQASA